MQRTIGFFVAAALSAPTAALADGQELGLATVLDRVAAKNPALAAYDSERQAARAHAVQAGLFRNPTLSTELENFAGSGDFDGTDRAEATIMLSQPLEIGGARRHRRQAAEIGVEVAAGDYERARAATLRDASIAFVDVLAEQQLLALVDEEIELADQVLATVRRRVEAGSVSRVELGRAETARSRARLERNNRTRALDGARFRLAAAWGAVEPDFSQVVGKRDSQFSVAPLEKLRTRLDGNPELRRWHSETARLEAIVELERSRAIPDVTIGAGYRRLEATEDNAMVAAISLPLPLFDRNQGAVEEARARSLRAKSQQQAAEIAIVTELARAHQVLTTARAEAETLETTILPQQTNTFEGLRAGFREGRFDYLEVLDAQRTLVEAKAQRVRALADYHRSVATIEWLTGAPLTAGLVVANAGQGERDAN
jgi:cobalt-zinc-cadmium efflux system outer membrane protein